MQQRRCEALDLPEHDRFALGSLAVPRTGARGDPDDDLPCSAVGG